MDQRNRILVRPWQAGDDRGIWKVLEEGSYSNVNSTFMLCLQRNEFRWLGIVVLCLGLGIASSWIWSLVYVLLYIASLYLISFASALVYLYGSTLSDIKNIPNSYFSSPGNHFWVAECNSKIAGTIAVTRKISQLKGSPDDILTDVHNSNLKKVAWLRRMVVAKKYRGLGIAKKLVKECLAYCKEQDYDSVFLITTEVHHAARSLYSNLGFKLIACKPYKYVKGLITVQTYEYEIEL